MLKLSEKPILELPVEVLEQEVVVDTKEEQEVVKTPLKQSKSKAKRYSK